MIKCVRKALDVSKVEDGAFLFMGFDMKHLGDERDISIKQYMKRLEDIEIRDKSDTIDCTVDKVTGRQRI